MNEEITIETMDFETAAANQPKKLGRLIREFFRKYPVALSCCVILTVLVSVLAFQDDIYFTAGDTGETIMDLLMRIAFGFLFFLLFSALSETVFAKKKSRIISLSASFLLSLFLALLLSDVFNVDIGEYFGKVILYALIFLIGSSFLLICYFMIRRSEKKFPEYFSSAFLTLLICGTGVLLIGNIVIITMLMNMFTFDDGTEMPAIIFAIFLFFILTVPSVLFSLSGKVNFSKTVFRVIGTYILTPLMGLTIFAEYLYLITAFLSGNVPNNVLFYLLLFVIIVTSIALLLNQAGSEGKKGTKILNRIYLFSLFPLLAVQIYSIAVRIMDCGLTPMRYFGCLILLFEILFMVLLLVKPEAIRELFLLAILALFVGLLCPGINANSASIASQNERLNSALTMLEEKKGTEEERARALRDLNGAYEFLSGYPKEVKASPENYSDEKRIAIKKYLVKDGEIDPYFNDDSFGIWD